jgi:hypothetical protein
VHGHRSQMENWHKEDRGLGIEVEFQGLEMPFMKKPLNKSNERSEKKESLTVTYILVMVTRHKYAPMAATAGLSFFDHQTAVVPNHSPVMAHTTRVDPINAHGGLSPPVMILPPQKKAFCDTCFWYLRIGLPVLGLIKGTADSGGRRSGGTGLKEGSSDLGLRGDPIGGTSGIVSGNVPVVVPVWKPRSSSGILLSSRVWPSIDISLGFEGRKKDMDGRIPPA